MNYHRNYIRLGILLIICITLQSCGYTQPIGTGLLSYVSENLVLETANGHFETFPFLQGEITSYNWSPDGKSIAFEDRRNFPGSDISIINIDGTGDKNLTTSRDRNEFDPSWSPDGRKIIFTSSVGGGHGDIWIINSDGTNPKQLTMNNGNNYNPSWSPDGKYIIFTSSLDGEPSIYRMKTDGSEIHLLANNGSEPSWNPDGKKIAFVRCLDKEIESNIPGKVMIVDNPEIFVMNSDGTDQLQLTNNPDYDIHPKWSLDGNKIAFVSRREENESCPIYDLKSGGTLGIYIMNPDGTELKLITDICEYGNFPNWKR